MKQRRFDIWSVALTTAVTLLIWYWAAGETRVSERYSGRITLRAADGEPWLLQPDSAQITIDVSGSRRQVRTADTRLRDIELAITPRTGQQRINIVEELRRHPDIGTSGITVTSADPPIIDISADPIITREARVLRRLPGARLEDEIAVEPRTVRVSFPESSPLNARADLTVEPVITREEVEALTPGSRITLPGIGVRPTGLRTAVTGLRIEPPQVTVTVTIRSQIGDHRLETPVRVQILSPSQDEGTVEMNPQVLRDVTITAPLNLIEQIVSREQSQSRHGPVVIAVLQLKSDERARRITEKRISNFMVLHDDGRLEVIEGRVGESGETHPVIQLTITP